MLTGELFEELVDLGHRLYQISLDGDKEEHERTRRHIAGKPTFERIMGHLYEIRATRLDFKVLLRLHLKPDNRDSLLALASRLKQDFLGDSRFSVLLKSIGNWGGPNSGKFDTLRGDDVKQRTSELKSALFGEASAEREDGDDSMPYVCYASTPNSLLVRPDGRIGKCTTALSDPLNDVGQISPDGTIQFNNESLSYWFQGLFSKNPSELACPYHFAHKPKVVSSVPIQVIRNVARAVS